jgi:hypothetical protein
MIQTLDGDNVDQGRTTQTAIRGSGRAALFDDRFCIASRFCARIAPMESEFHNN